ncbi:hypothetical protein [Coleofasciculus sp. F4-SAH-05]|uniref:hypothetical protein n=1 Tax=Coleofasciculus sp. F4-SAH-05 TaxID=3069525 RepID=UPI0032F6216D
MPFAQGLELEISSRCEFSSTSNPEELLRLEHPDTDHRLFNLRPSSPTWEQQAILAFRFHSDFSKNFTINKKIPFSCHNDRGNGKIDRADHHP